MKIKSILVLSVITLAFMSFTSLNTVQNSFKFEGTYDGHEDYGYNFIFADEDGEESTITLHKVSEEVLANFDLNSDKLVGTKFMVAYTSETVIEKDEEGYEDEVEVNTLVALKKL